MKVDKRIRATITWRSRSTARRLGASGMSIAAFKIFQTMT